MFFKIKLSGSTTFVENNLKFPDSKQKEWGRNTEEASLLLRTAPRIQNFLSQLIQSIPYNFQAGFQQLELGFVVLSRTEVYSLRLFCFVELSHKMAILHIVMASFKTGCPFHTKQNRFIKALLPRAKVIQAWY